MVDILSWAPFAAQEQPPMQLIDLRSDTVTRPTGGMLDAMVKARLGDDVFGEDPTANELEERLARMFGHEAGLFCPSGTMTNQIAIKVHTRPGDEVICDEGAHIYRYEGGGTMATSGCSVKLIQSDRGRFTAEQVSQGIHDPPALWLARTRLVSIENSCNRGGGAVWDLKEVRKIKALCDKHGLAMHMDGARIFNAMHVTGEKPEVWGGLFDTVSICLSKGLGAPAGSVLVGDRTLIAEARRVRKRLGGGMRQVGILAAACLFALDHHVPALVEDHRRAARLGKALGDLPYIKEVMPVVTNIVMLTLQNGIPADRFVQRSREHGVVTVALGPSSVRLVLHRDVSDADLEKAITIFNSLNP